jgi:hypothetical protein
MKSSWVGLLRIAASVLILGICAGSLAELYQNRANLSLWLGHFSPLYWSVLAGLLFCLAIFLTIGFVLIWQPHRFARTTQLLIEYRAGLGWLRWVFIFGLALLLPTVLLLTPLGDILNGPYFRLVLWLLFGFFAAIFCTDSPDHLASASSAAFSLVLIGIFHFVLAKLITVTNYPFMLIWSEGNRFYDYSVFFGSSRYIYPGKLTIPYNSPGRYMLWGRLFAIPHTPIWMHRLWNVLLWTVPYLILGILLSRWIRLNKIEKWTFILWTVLFLAQGPIYPTLILSGILIVAFTRYGKWPLTTISGAAAGYYATLSRYTWLPAAASWSGMILLSDFKQEQGEKIGRTILRLFPIGIVSLVIFAASALANSKLISPIRYADKGGMAFQQPLLWYRLFPNSTLQFGILVNALIAAGPLILLLIWLAVRKSWRVSWIQALGYTIPSLIFFAGGLVASIKIGGGSNLHNLDMFLISLAILAGLALKDMSELRVGSWPGAAQFLLAMLLLIPSWSVIRSGVPLHLADEKTVEQALESVYSKATRAKDRGEVLFLDHRQLLAFQYIKGIPLVPDYEKKYLMDQAMASNAQYFQAFYQDLARQRFSLIVSQPIFTNQKTSDESPFPEENNAWVKWVADPLLCYYTPVETIPEVQLQFLVPRSNPQGCP